MADGLFSMTQQRVLGLLSGQSHRRFFANELIDLTRSGSGAVQRELRRLTESCLGTPVKEGSRRYFQANQSVPLIAELQTIVLQKVGVAGPIGAALTPLVSQIHLALTYGSVAKGQEVASGDVDLLVVSDSLTLEQVFAALSPAEHQISRRINVTLYAPAEFLRRRRERSPVIRKVLPSQYIELAGRAHELGDAR